MAIFQFTFKSYWKTINKEELFIKKNEATFINTDLKQKIVFKVPIKAISYDELKELYLNLTDFIQENNEQKENTTIGELTVLNNPAGLMKKSKFDLFKDGIFKALSKEKLTNGEQEMVNNAKKLIEQLTGKK